MHTILIAGAALVGLPILLHLIMKQEPKRLSFPAFRFLTQKLKTNQRKLRLRHFVLLALRMLLIALFCLALYQPTLLSDSFNLRGEQPVAVVIVIDTSPSMGYTANERTRLEEAVKRARELLDELPDKSVVAVVTTDDPGAGFWQTVDEARKRLDELDRPRGGVQPVTSAVAAAYTLLANIKSRDVEEPEQLPKLVAVFTDRAAASWEAADAERLKKLREPIPKPDPAHAIVDIGIDQPVNVGLLAAEMKPQIIPANQPAVVVVTVAATGSADAPPVEATVLARLDGATNAERRAVKVPYGQSRVVSFEFPNLKPGLHQVEFSLETPDKLLADNTRFLTFKVGESRRILAVTDDPDAAVFWQAGLLAAKEPFSCLAVTPGDIRTDKDGRTVVVYAPNPDKPDEKLTDPLQAFEAVCLLGVREPNQPAGNTLWDKLRPYVEGNGKLIVIPGDETMKVEDYAAAGDLMPGTFRGLIETAKLNPPPPPQNAPGWNGPREGTAGVTWFLDDRVVQHPMLRPFQDWQSKGNVDAVKNPRRTWKYWDVAKDDKATVIVQYNDAEKAADRHPAVLERTLGKGKVVLLTTRMDVPNEEKDRWHDYWETEGSTWFSVFPWMLVRHLTGDTADANFNFLTGQSVTVPLPRGGVPKGTNVILNGPGIVGTDAVIEVGDKQGELRISPPRTNHPGNFRLSIEAPKWEDGYSLNVPPDESNLEKVPAEGIEDLTGKNTVVPVDKNLSLRDAIARTFNQPIDLFPWLLIAVLLLLAVEGLIANRFYRKVR